MAKPHTLDNSRTSIFVHPTAVVDDGARIGRGSRIWHFSHLMAGARIGQDCIIGQNVFVGNRVIIGDGVKIQNNVSVYEGVTLEDAVFCGPAVVFTNVLNPRSEIERKQAFQPTLVRHGATLGANCTVVCGRTVGRYALVGAGAVVTRDVPDHALVMGIPARLTGWVCRCGETIGSAAFTWRTGRPVRCTACGTGLTKRGQIVEIWNDGKSPAMPVVSRRLMNSSPAASGKR